MPSHASTDPTRGRSAGTDANPLRDPTRGRSAGTPANPLRDPTRSHPPGTGDVRRDPTDPSVSLADRD